MLSSRRDGNPLLYLFGKMWDYSTGNRSRVIQFWLMFVAAMAVANICRPLVWAQIMDVIQRQGITQASVGLLLKLLGLTLAIEAAFSALHYPARYMEMNNAFQARVKYRKYLLKGVMTLPMEWHGEHHSGDTIDKIEKGTVGLYAFAESSYEIIYPFVQLAVSYGMLVYLSHSAAYLVLIMILLTMWITMRFDRVIIEQYRELNRAENAVSASVVDAITNISTVIVLRVEKLVFDSILHQVRRPFGLFKRNNTMNEAKWCATSACCSMMIVLVLGAYFLQNMGSAQGVLVARVYLLLAYLNRIGQLFFDFCGKYGNVIQRKTRVANAEELARDFQPESFTDHVLPEDWRRLEIARLDFSYDSGTSSHLHLDNVSLAVTRGERIALVGETGGGKTTLLKIMRDLYHPRSMVLSVNGATIESGFGGIARAITLVPQDPEIFATTILKNITMGAEYEFETVMRFTDIACFTEVVEALPPKKPKDGLREKFDYSVQEKGVNLSTGQRQRLALARGLLACNDKEIALLDEPTSSIDAATGMTIHDNIFRAFPDKTIISSTHQLHYLPLFHRICYVNEGQITASGSLEHLLRNCAGFRALWESYHEHGVVR